MPMLEILPLVSGPTHLGICVLNNHHVSVCKPKFLETGKKKGAKGSVMSFVSAYGGHDDFLVCKGISYRDQYITLYNIMNI